MLRTAFLIFIYILVCFNLAAAGVKTVTATYIYQIPDNLSQDEAREIALHRAQAQAIADEYGTIVTQTTSTYIETYNDESSTDFLSIGGSELRGEWIETIGDPKYELITDGSMMGVRVEVKGKIREIEGNRVPFSVKLLRNGITDADENDRFVSGDGLYVSFNSPTSGFLAVYLIDSENRAFCLLPYQNQEDGIFNTKANKNYILFHPDYADGIGKEIVDELVLDTSQERERNRILTIFSPNRFYKAADKKISEEYPRSLSYKEFQKWLSEMKKRDTDLTISEKAILINSK